MHNDLFSDELMTDHDREEARHAETRRRNHEREIQLLRKSNRKKNLPEPKPGDILHVQLRDRGLARRSRAGVTFAKGPSQPVEVVALSDEDVLEAQKSGKNVVNPDGAERILDDDALIVRQEAFGDADDLAAALAKADALELENRALREQLAATKSDREQRQSKMDAGDTTRITRPPSKAKDDKPEPEGSSK